MINLQTADRSSLVPLTNCVYERRSRHPILPPVVGAALCDPGADYARTFGNFISPTDAFQHFSMPRTGVRLPPSKDSGTR